MTEPPMVLSLWKGVIPRVRTMVDIAQAVAEQRGFPYAKVMGRSTKKDVSSVRHEVWATIRKERPDLSYPQIAKFANRDHTVIMYGVRRHCERAGWAL